MTDSVGCRLEEYDLSGLKGVLIERTGVLGHILASQKGKGWFEEY